MALVSTLKNKLILTTALAATLMGYGGRRAYAAGCNPGGGGTYICDGVNVAPLVVNANNAVVSTDPGFSVIYNGNTNAITITGDGAMSFTDVNGSTITQTGGSYSGLRIRSNGDNFVTPGSVTIDANSDISGIINGIFAINYGTGALSTTAEGDVTGGYYGILTQNSQGTDLTITTGADSVITGTNYDGIRARNKGIGAISITADGYVTGGSNGIYAFGDGTDLTITTGADSVITGTSKYGIFARNGGTGALTITADGDVTGTSGIYSLNTANGTDMLITTATGSLVTGTVLQGINAAHSGTGELTLTIGGDVLGGYAGISATNAAGTDTTITTAVGSTITGSNNAGISVSHSGTGTLSIAANGTVNGNSGIVAFNNVYATGIDIATGASSLITGTLFDGVYTYNWNGTTSITVDGDVTANRKGIFALNYGATSTDLTITTAAGTTVTGTTDYGIYAGNRGVGATLITANGDVSGQSGIYAFNATTATDLTIMSDTGTTITGTLGYGIYANNQGAGALTVTINGDIVANSYGIRARNLYGTDMTITTGSGTAITGTTAYGMYLQQQGTGALSITAHGDVTGKSGIFARSTVTATDLIISTGASTAITGTNYSGILARHRGTGEMSISAAGDVIGGDYGINAYNEGTNLTITAAAGTNITGTDFQGILAYNYGTGALTIANSGTISGDTGLKLRHYGAMGSITNNAGATIEGTGGTAIDMRSLSADLALTINGGRIIGDVVDDTIANGFSAVTIAEDFTSEGSFTVSDFGVSSGKVFTFGAGEDITSFNAVENDGEMVISAAGSAITGGLKVNSGGILTAGDDFSISGQLTNNGTIDIATNRTLTAGTMAAGTGTLTFGVTSLADHAQLTLTGGAANLTGQTITIDVAGVNAIAANDEILLIDGLGALIGGPGAVAASVTDNSVLWNFEIIDGTGIGAPTDNSDLFLRAAMAASLTDLSDTSNNENAAGVLIDLEGATANPELLDILANLNGAGTVQEFNDIVEAVQPTVDGGAITTSITFADSALNLTGERLSSLRQGADGTPAMTGSNAKEMFYLLGIGATQNNVFGEDPRNEALKGRSKGSAGISGSQMFSLTGVRSWGQLFGQTARQGQRGGIDGYDSGTGGIAVGIDSENIFKHGIAGLAFTYGRTQVDSNNATRTDTDVNSYQLTFYSDHDLGQGIYANAMAGYSFNTNDTLRHDVGGVPGLNAEGDFDSQMISARTEVGKAYAIDNLTLTPTLSANWVHYMADSYRETGAGGANLNVSSKDLDQLELGIGGKAAWHTENSDGSKTVSELHAGYRREMIGDSLETTSSFTGGGAAFSGQGPDPAQDKFNVGAQIKYYSINNIELTAAYDLDIKQDYTAHAGFLRMGWKF